MPWFMRARRRAEPKRGGADTGQSAVSKSAAAGSERRRSERGSVPSTSWCEVSSANAVDNFALRQRQSRKSPTRGFLDFFSTSLERKRDLPSFFFISASGVAEVSLELTPREKKEWDLLLLPAMQSDTRPIPSVAKSTPIVVANSGPATDISDPTPTEGNVSPPQACASSPTTGDGVSIKVISSMPRNGSWIWDWKTSNPPSTPSSTCNSRNSSLHGGGAFSPLQSLKEGKQMAGGDGLLPSPPNSRNNSSHGGNIFGKGMRRNVSWGTLAGRGNSSPRTVPPDDAGTAIPTATGGSMRRNGSSSWLWNWGGQSPAPSTPNSSRDASAHGGNAVGGLLGLGSKEGTATPIPGVGKQRRGSLGFLWDWAKFRSSPPASRDPSLHGGNAFTPGQDDAAEGQGEEQEAHADGSDLPTIEPPKGMRRNLSLGSYMWHWGAQRTSPTSTPGNSHHGSSQFSNMSIEDDVLVTQPPAIK
jgi:hypothetical protein